MKKRKNHAHHHIHRTLRKHAPKSYKRVKSLSTFKYPKLLLLCASIFLAYNTFNDSFIQNIITHLDRLSYIGIFISGALVSFGFSAPFGVGFLLNTIPGNLLIGSIIGGIGSTVGDILIFRTIKNSFMKEFNELNKVHVIRKIEKIVEGNKRVLIRHYLLYIFAGIIIAAPILPDEIGVSMLAGLTTIKQKKLIIISFILHTLAILLILKLGMTF